MPAAAGEVLRWPASAGALYHALGDLLGRSADAALPALESEERQAAAAIDATAFAALEKSLGLTTLIEILQSYVKTAEELSARLEQASASGNWDDATRIAQDIAGAAGGLGLSALTGAARGLHAEGPRGRQRRRPAQGRRINRRRARPRAPRADSLYPDLAA